jgi:hypothetical protein
VGYVLEELDRVLVLVQPALAALLVLPLVLVEVDARAGRQ